MHANVGSTALLPVHLPLEVLQRCLDYTSDSHILLDLECTSHEVRAAHLVIPGPCETTIGTNWSHDIHKITRLAALHHQLQRVRRLTIHVDSLPEHFFERGCCRHLTSLTLSSLALVPDCVSDLEQLRALSLAGNFNSLPNSIGSCKALQLLSVSSTTPEWLQCLCLPESLCTLPNLHTLKLDITTTVAWPTALSATTAFTALTSLFLRNPMGAMKLQGLSSNALPALQELHVQGCDLAHMGLEPLLNPNLQLLDLGFADCGAFASLGGLVGLLQAAAAALTRNGTLDDGNHRVGFIAADQQQQRCAQCLAGLKTLQLQAPNTGLAVSSSTSDTASASSAAETSQPLAARHHVQQLHTMQQHAGPVAATADQLASCFSNCLSGLTCLELTIHACTTTRSCSGGNVDEAEHVVNAAQPLYTALSCLPQLRWLKLSGLQDMPTCSSSSSSAGCLAALTHLRELDMADCGSVASSHCCCNDNTGQALRARHSGIAGTSNSESAGSGCSSDCRLDLPDSITRLRFVRCSTAVPLQQVVSQRVRLRELIIDAKTAEHAGDVSQLLKANECRVQVEN